MAFLVRTAPACQPQPLWPNVDRQYTQAGKSRLQICPLCRVLAEEHVCEGFAALEVPGCPGGPKAGSRTCSPGPSAPTIPALLIHEVISLEAPAGGRVER